ncbi:hypothetical protein CEXT_785311 [Caerostris extrusa]|uniref:Uncharacterized protein n=1 Tax=Caerostris extrusa TaxID=172846 RepID=A0AAV4TV23_CAEEX|nr:hypothetical protein CEXT_785311 [Caerostris extrusa]
MDVGVLTTRNSQESGLLRKTPVFGKLLSGDEEETFSIAWRTRIPRDRRRLIAYNIYYYDGARSLDFMEDQPTAGPQRAPLRQVPQGILDVAPVRGPRLHAARAELQLTRDSHCENKNTRPNPEPLKYEVKDLSGPSRSSANLLNKEEFAQKYLCCLSQEERGEGRKCSSKITTAFSGNG